MNIDRCCLWLANQLFFQFSSASPLDDAGAGNNINDEGGDPDHLGADSCSEYCTKVRFSRTYPLKFLGMSFTFKKHNSSRTSTKRWTLRSSQCWVMWSDTRQFAGAEPLDFLTQSDVFIWISGRLVISETELTCTFLQELQRLGRLLWRDAMREERICHGHDFWNWVPVQSTEGRLVGFHGVVEANDLNLRYC